MQLTLTSRLSNNFKPDSVRIWGPKTKVLVYIRQYSKVMSSIDTEIEPALEN